MEQVSLTVEARSSLGKNANRKTRKLGKLPGVIYGLGKNTAITVNPKALYDLLLQEGGSNKIIKLTGGGLDGRSALVKDYIVDPVKRNLLHVDLLEIDITKKIVVTVPLNFTGRAAGVAEGGVLNIVQRKIDVRCLPTAIPKHIDCEVTALNIGDSIHLNDLALPEGVERMDQVNATLVTVVPPTKEEEAAPSLAPAAEPEVITEKKPAEGAAAEGAAAGDGKDAKKEEKKK